MPASKRSSMSKLSKNTKDKVDLELKDEELEILRNTTIDWETLKPKVSDKETYNKLIAVVKESTAKNESVAQLKSRIKKLGKSGVKILKEVKALVK